MLIPPATFFGSVADCGLKILLHPETRSCHQRDDDGSPGGQQNIAKRSYDVGSKFVHAVAKDGVPQALVAVVQCVLCLPGVIIVKLAGYDLGYAAEVYSGSLTISAASELAMARSEQSGHRQSLRR